MASYDQQVRSIPNVQLRASQTLNFARVSSAPLCALVDFERSLRLHKRTRPILSVPPAPPIWMKANNLRCKGENSFHSVTVNCWPRQCIRDTSTYCTTLRMREQEDWNLFCTCFVLLVGDTNIIHSFIHSVIHSSFICSRLTLKNCKIKRGFCYSE